MQNKTKQQEIFERKEKNQIEEEQAVSVRT